jgi:tyrosyl-tRNA synthetase
MNKILEDLKARGMVSETFGPIEENLKEGEYVYCGCDPTSDSLGVHHLLAFMTLKRLKEQGMKPIVLIGGATGSLGDPSYKEKERDFISMDVVMHNCECIKNQLRKIVGEDVIFVNNYDWISKFSFLDFMRDIGKKISVNYMMAKDSVKTRLAKEGSSLSFCEFSYSNIQAFDFVHLYEQYGCKIQIGGRDQTGNIDSAFVLAHKRNKVDNLSAFVWPLLTCSDGRKFGKSEGNTIWLDPNKTNPYTFYQYFINLPDEDTESLIKKFTLIPLDEINSMIEKHRENPSARLLQKELAKYMTVLVHSEEDYNKAVEASQILFGKATTDTLEKMDERTFIAVMRDVNKVEIKRQDIDNGISVIDVATMHNKIPSKSEARKLIKANGFSINKEKVVDEKTVIDTSKLINNKYLLLQKGKKEYTLVVSV